MDGAAQTRDFSRASAAFIWLIEPRSHGLRSNRVIALTLTLIGPSAWGVATLSEVAMIERVSERTLRDLRRELRLSYGLAPPKSVFAGPHEGVNAIQDATAPDFAEMDTDDDEGFFAGPPDL
jgi:hypothetical protein